MGKRDSPNIPFGFRNMLHNLIAWEVGSYLSSVFRGKYRGKEGMGREKEKKVLRSVAYFSAQK